MDKEKSSTEDLNDDKIIIKCNNCSDEDATSWCVQCCQFICHDCVKSHERLNITKEHTIVAFQIRISSDVTYNTVELDLSDCGIFIRCNNCSDEDAISWCVQCCQLIGHDCVKSHERLKNTNRHRIFPLRQQNLLKCIPHQQILNPYLPNPVQYDSNGKRVKTKNLTSYKMLLPYTVYVSDDEIADNQTEVPQGGNQKEGIVVLDNITTKSPGETFANEQFEDQAGSKQTENVSGYWVSDDDDFDVPPTQEIIQIAFPKFKEERKSTVNVLAVAGNPKDLMQSVASGDRVINEKTSKRGCAVAPIEYTAVKPITTKESAEANMFDDEDDDNDDMFKDLPSTQQLLKTSIIPKPSREQLMKTTIKSKPKSQEHLHDFDDILWHNIPPTQELLETAIIPKPKSSTMYVAKTRRTANNSNIFKAKNRQVKNSPHAKAIKSTWLKCKTKYVMSDGLFEEIFDTKTNKVNHEKFLYRKDSVAMEIDKIFPGCVIYVRRFYESKTCWVLRAYCAHLQCRRYTLKADYANPNTFSIEYDQPTQIHKQVLARQIRRFERDEMQSKLVRKFPNALRQNAIKNADSNSVEKGNLQGVASLPVYQEVRREALARQDNDTNDIEDVAAMKTDDPNTNFISDTLPSYKYGVYLHAKNQHDVLNKLHKIRAENGKPIVVRLDASGDIARDVPAGKLLYHALTVNLFVDNDQTSTALPITEQYNTRNTSKDIAKWLFDCKLSHAQWYENHPLLFDILVSDFSYANFHAVLKALNNMSLANFLNAAYTWITVLLATGKFPAEYGKLVKIHMCYTHLMSTFADMCRRLFGKTTNGKQLPQSKIILEILGSLIKASDYRVILQLWKQLVILLNNEFANEDIYDALVMVKKITTSVDLDDFSDDKLTDVIDVDNLPEKDDTLYKNNLFYIQFASYTNQNYFGNNPKHHMEKNIYYNPSFLDTFLKRFVPLIPFWTNVLTKEDNSILLNVEPVESISKMEAILKQADKVDFLPSDLEQYDHIDMEPILKHPNEVEPIAQACFNREIHLLEVLNNQPLETYFGKFKRELRQNAVNLGQPPVKLGRAITLSRGIIDSTIKSVNLGIKKSQCNTQKPRKKYQKKPKPPSATKINIENSNEAEISGENLVETEILSENETDLNTENLMPNPEVVNFANIEANIDSENLAETQIPGKNLLNETDLNAENLTNIEEKITGENLADVGINLRKRKPVSKKTSNVCTLMSTKVKPTNTTSLKESKENYNKKRPIKKFSYFQGKSIAKVDSVDSSTVYENSLFKNVSVYYNIRNYFVVESNNKDSYLSNHDFDLLHRKEELSPALMKYLTSCYPDNVQVLILSNKDAENMKLLQNTVFVLIHINHWVLFIIDKAKKLFYPLNPKQPNTDSDFGQIFSKLKLPKSYKEKSFPIHTKMNEIYNTGIYVYAYMMEYITKRTVSKNRIYGNSIRLDLENQVIKKSNDMAESCLICGSDSDHPLGIGWTQCTNCDRWMHCYCADIDFKEAELDDTLKCCVCSNTKLPESS